jgi:glycosyltransferase involved in cell wall biosynthesis
MSTQKFAVVSHIVPPSYSGQAVMLYRILKKFNPEDYLIIASSNQDKNIVSTNILTCENLTIPLYKRINSIYCFVFLKPLNFLRAINQRSRELAKILKRYPNINTLVACTGDFIDLPACYMCAKKTKIKLVCYLFDDYVSQWTGFMGFLAWVIHRPIFRFSKSLIVPNEFLANKYKFLNSKIVIVRNPINPSGNVNKIEFTKNNFNIVYTGAVYDAHLDAFKSFVSCIKKIPDARLHLYTAQPKKDLLKSSILTDQVIYHPHLRENDVANVLASADLLFLPLAFNSPYPEVIRTSAPGKMGEYLQSGRPTIVYAPKNSFISDFFRKNYCGVVVDEQNEQLLIEAIEKIRENKDLVKEIKKNSLKIAREFDIDKNILRFKRALK